MLSPFVAIQGGVRYRVSITTTNAHSETLCSSSAPKSLYYPLTNGPVTAQQSFWGAAGVFPTLSTCNNLWVGVVFDKT
jgi:hypothetical protein